MGLASPRGMGQGEARLRVKPVGSRVTGSVLGSSSEQRSCRDGWDMATSRTHPWAQSVLTTSFKTCPNGTRTWAVCATPLPS